METYDTAQQSLKKQFPLLPLRRIFSNCDDGKKKHGENCELKSAAAFDPFSVCNVIDALPIWVDHLFGFSLLLQASNGQCKFQQQSDIYSKHCPQILLKEEMPSNSVLPLFLVLLVTFHWTLCQCFVLPTFREFQDFFKRASKSVPASDELTNGWKSLLSSMLPKILPEKTADMVRTVVDMVKLVNTSQPTSNEEHFNEAAAVTKSITVDETIIRVPARSPSVMEQSLGLLRPFFGNIDPWRAILYRDPPLLSVDLADGDSQENDMTRSTLSLDSFKSNFFKSTNHDSQLLDELETEPVAAKRPVDYFNYYYNS
ncbi:putative gluconeogenesis factor [Trichinella spiralis]|uniref:Gluconeogenesis factor n=1 Tax=Trichinella spiralis TaxID=6334 RepID=A0ABR3KDL7_TRISP